MNLQEIDSSNLRQRYIEWQAEINLLEDRTAIGTGAGCINNHRSNYYYRLPKLNTLQAFDQNGWLACGAETGVWGLVCFSWIIVHHVKLAYCQIKKIRHDNSFIKYRFAIANFAGLLALCVANLFSSVHYNGVLIVFVLVLALISKNHSLFGEEQCK